jgi:phytoene/squalene synthetase
MAADPQEGKSAVRLQLLEGRSAVWLQWFKEVVTAVLGIGIVAYTLYWTGRAFAMAGDPTRMGDAKDLLTFLSGFAGLVVGYYFGRVPADARTTQAQQQMAQAQQQMGQAMSEKEQAMGTMNDMKNALVGLEEKAKGGEQLQPEDVQHVREMA